MPSHEPLAHSKVEKKKQKKNEKLHLKPVTKCIAAVGSRAAIALRQLGEKRRKKKAAAVATHFAKWINKQTNKIITEFHTHFIYMHGPCSL